MPASACKNKLAPCPLVRTAARARPRFARAPSSSPRVPPFFFLMIRPPPRSTLFPYPTLSRSLATAEAQAWASIVAVSGGMTIFSDHLPKLPPERLPILLRTLPVAPVAGRPGGTGSAEAEVAPALVDGEQVYRIGSPWHFRTGDDPRYAAREDDESAGETIPVPQRWERAGHPDYGGFAWDRTRFPLPPTA